MSTDIQDESRLDTLDARMDELRDKCHFASCMRVAQELRRAAREDADLRAYVNANFAIMNYADCIFEPSWAREAAIEMIGLLENEDQARAIEPDLEDEEYVELVNWYSSCAYDNLGKATAEISGFNSDGVHACIAEGIEVCRKTGKTQCITCFREYATDVHFAADDMDMAMHYARMRLQNTTRRHDRRYVAAKDEVHVLLAQGKLSAVPEKIEQLLSLIDTWHQPYSARLSSKTLITAVACLLGEPERWKDQCVVEQPPAGEDLSHECQMDEMRAVIDFAAGNYDSAIKRLTPWDQKLLRQECVNTWLGLRTRLLAIHKAAGNVKQFEKLATQLENKAKKARDWHILRCLKHLRDPNCIPVPYPAFANMDCGAFGIAPEPALQHQQTAESDATRREVNSASDSQTEKKSEREVPESIEKIVALLRDAATVNEETQTVSLDPTAVERVLDQILATDPAEAAEAESTSWLIHTVTNLLPDGNRADEFWSWAKRMIAPLGDDATALSLVAKLGCLLRYGHDKLGDEIDDTTLEKMFRESLDLDPEQPGNFERAGNFYRYNNNLGEAERCYARSFRLDRSRESAASSLAAIYRRTDRERDALEVLDMAIRNGGQEPDLFWDAAITAFSLERHEQVVTYLDAYEKAAPNQRWTNHYRAASLIALERFAEARGAAQREQELNAEHAFPYLVHLTAAAAGLGESETFRELANKVLELRLADVDYLNFRGMEALCRTFYAASARVLDIDDELNRMIEDRMLASNMAPDELFERHRNDDDAIDGINFYRCTFEQPLDDQWQAWHGRFASEEELSSFQTTWGVLAESEEQAIELASRWQDRCYPLDAKLIGAELADDGFRAGRGVTWQGWRQTPG